MKKIGSINALVISLVVCFFSSQAYADSKEISYEGYWIYGFEQSLFESCDGKMYWMWVLNEFKGIYKEEGYRNHVKVIGRLLSPDPDNNMNSPFPTLKMIEIKHASQQC